VGLLKLIYTRTLPLILFIMISFVDRDMFMHYAGIGVGHGYAVMMLKDNEDGEHINCSNDDDTPDHS